MAYDTILFDLDHTLLDSHESERHAYAHTAAWAGLTDPDVHFDTYVTIVLTSYAIKLAAAIVVTPVIYLLHEVIEKKYGIDPAPVEVASADIGGKDERSRG